MPVSPEAPLTVLERLQVWAWSPIIVLRVALLITYGLYVYFAVISFIAGVPVFNLTTPEGYTPVWAVLLGIAALIAAIGSIADRWNHWERWASLVVSSLMLTYVGSLNAIAFIAGDVTRQAVGGAVAIGLVLPMCRFFWLASQAGKKRK